MIILASSSMSRAKILADYNIEFEQIFVDYDESYIEKISPSTYCVNVVNEKSKQFFAKFKLESTKVLFADSSVVCDGAILGKAKKIDDARYMLNLQSANKVIIYTAMKLFSTNFTLDALSTTFYQFSKFKDSDVEAYLNSGLWKNKAGAMMIEGFYAKYILKSRGSKETAMGLDIHSLRTFL